MMRKQVDINCIIKPISIFSPTLLTGFSHDQKWSEQWVKQEGAWVLEQTTQCRKWSNDKKVWISSYLEEQTKHGGQTYGAYIYDRLVGFAAHGAPKMIDEIKWINLTMLFVDEDYKRRGIGTLLFDKIITSAKEKGVEKIFVSAIPSKETIAFYFSQGCVDAKTAIEEFVDTQQDRYIEYTV